MNVVLPQPSSVRRIFSMLAALVLTGAAAKAQIRITEYMYSGANGEFVEFTNVGAAAIDMTGWSFDDANRHVGVHSLSGFGVVQPGESAIVTETTPVSAFRSAWNLCAGVKIVGGYTNDNLGRADEINLYDAAGNQVDRLTYDDQTLGSPRTQNKSAWVSAAGLGANQPTQWTLSATGDAEGSFTSAGGDIGSPGKSTRATVAFNPCVVVDGAPTIVINTAATTNFLDGGVTTAPLSPFALSGVPGDSTDPARNLGIDFTVGDDRLEASRLIVTVTSNNTAVVPNENITLTNNGASRNIKITPIAVGYATLTVTVSDSLNHTDFLLAYAASANSTTPPFTRWPTGISDASDAIALDDHYYVTGDDEQDVLNVYSRWASGLPLISFNYAAFLNLPEPNKPEVDVEAATPSPLTAGKAYWLGSMSNGKSPFDNKPNRDRIFATTITGTGASTAFNVTGFGSLRAALLTWGDDHGYGFTASAAAGVDSKTPSGFAAEGMVFGPDSTTLYIGLRAPLVPTANRTKAVIAPILSFEAWFSAGAAGSPAFGTPIELDLGGRGIRDLIRLSNGTYIILAGSPGESINGALYKWTGKASDAPIRVVSPNSDLLNAEGAMAVNTNGQLSLSDLQVITDKGGDVLYNDGVSAKDLGAGSYKKFRLDDLHSLDLTLPVINRAPAVIITSPVNGASYPAGTKVTVQAQATDSDGQVMKVEFFNAGVRFAVDSMAPYEVAAADVEPGNYLVTARATDDKGDTAVSDTVHVTITGCTGSGFISGEGYTNIPGAQVADLTGNPAYPDHPSVHAQLHSFEYGPNLGDNYGARVRGYVCAPQTGDYTFYISGDDQAGLWLSTDDSPAHKALIAYAGAWTGFREYNKYATQHSAAIHLVKGARYYVETLHKENTGQDHLSVAWRLPNGTYAVPIPGSVLSPYTDSVIVTSSQSFTDAMRMSAGGWQSDVDTTGGLSVKVGPNPTHGAFTLMTRSSNSAALIIRVTDISGRVVETRTGVAPNGTIQLGADFHPGVYFAEIVQGNSKIRIRLLKL
ncbi:lamin tail domain-containing protein [Flavitalea sp. BT771]|uniref:lamin tail domain-containing protein n=1 Tax=Flavitalea sp. BT771 TaxID=3063329 RepID=UPI0026E46991|nr:lamin tail domain-containing protein [Flavitalea sp. BT771]MDO6430725.1 lamin tail domain-containing protein [Flavitalea sp. BT771]MDV6219135.1 lamin tail domain-containing protein [Flavitalea sp. BT771]